MTAAVIGWISWMTSQPSWMTMTTAAWHLKHSRSQTELFKFQDFLIESSLKWTSKSTDIVMMQSLGSSISWTTSWKFVVLPVANRNLRSRRNHRVHRPLWRMTVNFELDRLKKSETGPGKEWESRFCLALSWCRFKFLREFWIALCLPLCFNWVG